jgi:cysteinyl-tRNA synthetase
MTLATRIFERARARLSGRSALYLHNTLTDSRERFTLPPQAHHVRMYNCGPTVYGVQHIGNLSMFVFTDLLRRALEYNGYSVKQVINFTDVGHLAGDNQGDADQGEDRMTKGMLREGMQLTLENMRALGEKYAHIFQDDLRKLNIDTTRITFPYASDYIQADIAMVQTLEEKGYAYVGKSGVYFDTSRFARYGELGGINLSGLRAGARVELASEKRNPTDFLLWKFDSRLGWESPWGRGFPGWHIECSAMIRSCLGQQIDIHTGGIEHIPIHHNNEIAQSECTTGKRPLSRFWLHRAHLQIAGGKIAKSEGNVVYLSDIIDRGFHPLALRYLFLSAHYRTSSNFSWEALEGAQTALGKLVAFRLSLGQEQGSVLRSSKRRFARRINDDLDTAGALALVWEMTKRKTLKKADLLATLLDFDSVLGLNLANPDDLLRTLAHSDLAVSELPAAIRELLRKREEARARKDWVRSDELRDELLRKGFSVKDTPDGQRVSARVTPQAQS